MNTATVQSLKSSPRLRTASPAPAPRAPRTLRPLGVVQQVREALKRRNRLAAALGFLLGGFVPVASFVVAHGELDAARSLWLQPGTALVLGGLLFSAKTVYSWSKLAFGESSKALGFVVLLEGVMILAKTGWLGAAALGLLVGINGVATACRVARG